MHAVSEQRIEISEVANERATPTEQYCALDKWRCYSPCGRAARCVRVAAQDASVEDCPEAILELADWCLQVNPDDRPTGGQIVREVERIVSVAIKVELSYRL